jgi:hypothetical protein
VRRTLLLALATAALSVAGASASYASTTLPRAASSGTPIERHCGGTTAFKDGDGYKANVNSCVQTNGQFMTVSAPADCFAPAVIGYSRYKTCSSDGSWRMLRGGNEVATGRIDVPLPYVGPGTYTVISKVSTWGGGDFPGGSAQFGSTQKTFTLTTALIALPFSASITPDHLALGQGTDLTFTVTRSQGNAVNSSQFYLDTPIATTADPRCRRAEIGFGVPAVTACNLKLGPGESTQIKVTAKLHRRECIPVRWRVTWGSGYLPGIVPCPNAG